MYENKLSEYYDSLYSSKNYKLECDFIEKNIPNGSLLDVGCGTINHSVILSKKYKSIIGVDISKPMIDVAEKKIKILNIENITLINKNITELSYDSAFDGVISMFNVVNHIISLPDLISFLQSINTSLKKNGKFIFDLWNGVASTIDPPHVYNKKISYYDYYTLISETKSETNLMNAITIMKTKVSIFDDESLIDEFDYEIKQKLWTPDLIFEILKMVGFESIDVFPFFDSTKTPKETDHRLTILCIKK